MESVRIHLCTCMPIPYIVSDCDFLTFHMFIITARDGFFFFLRMNLIKDMDYQGTGLVSRFVDNFLYKK